MLFVKLIIVIDAIIKYNNANESFSAIRLPAVLKHFKHNYPDVDIRLVFGSVKAIHEHLQNNSADVAFFFTREKSYSDLIIETLMEEPVVMEVRRGVQYVFFQTKPG